MPNAIPDLWPDDLRVTDVLTPLAIMRYQAAKLRQISKGVLEAKVDSVVDDDYLDHRFVVIAPALDRYEYVLFHARHSESMVYPVDFGAAALDVIRGGRRTANFQEEFVDTVAWILASAEVRSVIESLVARSSDVTTD